MSRVSAWNLLGVALALGAGMLASGLDSMGAASASAPRDEGRDARVESLVDASGFRVPVGEYHRIIGLNHVADHLLVELVPRERILALSGFARPGSAEPQRFEGIPTIAGPPDVEALIELGPDLVVVNRFMRPSTAAHLREAGIAVFDLGEMRGLASLLDHARILGTLLGVPEQGRRFAERFETRMRAVAADVPRAERPRAMYLGTHGGQLFGGTRGTSYHDVLVHGGLVDAAAERYEGWPALTSEQVLELDPELLVTAEGKADELCHIPGLERLRPCRGEGRIVEVPAAVLIDPGTPMLEAAEAVRRAVHGPPPDPEAMEATR